MDKNKQNNDDGKLSADYSKYTGIIFQMIATIGVFALAGYLLDKKLKNATPWVTAVSCLLGVCLSLYQVIRQVSK